MNRLNTMLESVERSDLAVVLGGMVQDIVGKSNGTEAETLHTSKDGVAWEKDGGVGRNVCEAISRLRGSAAIISAVGGDTRGAGLCERLKKVGVDTRCVRTVPSKSTASYHCILANDGSQIAAVAAMQVLDEIQIGAEEARLLGRASILCMDGNPPYETIQKAVAVVSPSALVVFEPTSVPKSLKAVPHLLPCIDLMTPNEMEVLAMARSAGAPGPPPTTAPAAARVLISLGVLVVVVTQGKQGATIFFGPAPSDEKRLAKWKRLTGRSSPINYITTLSVPAQPLSDIVDVTGAGDSLLAGIIAGLLSGKSLQQAVLLGAHAARSTLQSPMSVSTTMFQDCNALL